MTKGRLLACAGAALSAIMILSADAAAAQTVAPSTPRIGHIGMPLYLRVPVGSRGEAAALKADQAAVLASQQATAKKAKKKR